jgi:glutamate-1-semialdehyde 2,1-aminomutase
MFTVHFTQRPISTPRDIPTVSRRFAQIFHLECLLNGVLLASRGDVFISLPTLEHQYDALRKVTQSFVENYEPMLRRELDAATSLHHA